RPPRPRRGLRPGPGPGAIIVSMAPRLSLPAGLLAAALALGARPAVAPARGPVSVADPARRDCGLEAPGIARRAPPVPRRAHELAAAGATPLVRRHPGGALGGKTVYVSAGHGFAWTGTAWRTQ